MNMTSFPLIDLQTKLAIEENLPLPYAGVLANLALNHFVPEVREGVIQWLQGELKDDFEVNGLSVAELCDMASVSPFTALCMMNVSATDPESMRLITWFDKADLIVSEDGE